jgi:effector-binding domain-containing protein
VTGEITVIEIRPRPLAAVRVTTELAKWPGQFRKSLDKVYTASRAGKVQQSGHNVMVYYPRPDGQVDIECGIEVAAKFEPYGEVVWCQTPEGLAVTAAQIGPYQELGASHRAIVDWCRKRGHKLTGTCWEIYGDSENDPAKLRTNLFHLLARLGAPNACPGC